jgi:hypothetical protein
MNSMKMNMPAMILAAPVSPPFAKEGQGGFDDGCRLMGVLKSPPTPLLQRGGQAHEEVAAS